MSLDQPSRRLSDVAQVGHDGGQLRLTLLLAPQLPLGTRRRQHRRLEVVDHLSTQNQVLQELCFIRPGLLGHVRKPFIPVVAQEYDVLQELAKAHRKREPCGEALGFQSRGLQNLTKRHARQQRIGRLPNTGKAKKTPTPNPHRSAISGTNSRSKARLSGSTYDSAPGT